MTITVELAFDETATQRMERIEHLLIALTHEVKTMHSEITDFKAKMDTVLAAINVGILNIAGDVASLNTQIADLKAKLEAGGKLEADDLAALTAVSDAAAQLAAKTKDLAESTPDAVPA